MSGGLRLTLVVLAVLAIAAGAYWGLRGREEVVDGDGSLIAAPATPYKVRPDEAGGMAVEGQGDASFAASEGIETDAAINFGAAPEAPIAGARAVPAGRPATGSGRTVEAGVTAGGTLARPKPPHVGGPGVDRAAVAGRFVDLGGFENGAAANGAWTRLAGRFAYLQAMPHGTLESSDGQVRLRVDAGPDRAAALCGRMRVAGEACTIVQ